MVKEGSFGQDRWEVAGEGPAGHLQLMWAWQAAPGAFLVQEGQPPGSCSLSCFHLPLTRCPWSTLSRDFLWMSGATGAPQPPCLMSLSHTAQAQALPSETPPPAAGRARAASGPCPCRPALPSPLDLSGGPLAPSQTPCSPSWPCRGVPAWAKSSETSSRSPSSDSARWRLLSLKHLVLSTWKLCSGRPRLASAGPGSQGAAAQPPPSGGLGAWGRSATHSQHFPPASCLPPSRQSSGVGFAWNENPSFLGCQGTLMPPSRGPCTGEPLGCWSRLLSTSPLPPRGDIGLLHLVGSVHTVRMCRPEAVSEAGAVPGEPAWFWGSASSAPTPQLPCQTGRLSCGVCAGLWMLGSRPQRRLLALPQGPRPEVLRAGPQGWVGVPVSVCRPGRRPFKGCSPRRGEFQGGQAVSVGGLRAQGPCLGQAPWLYQGAGICPPSSDDLLASTPSLTSQVQGPASCYQCSAW